MAMVEQEVPPMQMGDRLSREEFLRRWRAHPKIKRAELIQGIVYMPSPVGLLHGSTENHVSTWAGYYAAHTPGIGAANNATTLMLGDAPQPDVHLRILTEYGGKTSVVDNLLAGAPEHISEVCLTSAVYDLHQKLELYQKAKVAEYLAVLLHEKEIRWHCLGSQGYQLLPPGSDGVWRSQVFPGLWLAGNALFAGDIQHVLRTLQEGLESPEHQQFVAALAQRKKL
ncbi:MAG: Uma2 family endonuclease [Gemmataceae bacterium]|nr:Uma2 family endonuclease [Gemmataceae bacterium]